MTYTKKTGLSISRQQSEVYIDGEYIGSYTEPETSLDLWVFRESGCNYEGFSAHSEEELIQHLKTLVDPVSEPKLPLYESTIKFMYFAHNFPPNWVWKCWGRAGDTVLSNHLIDKWHGYGATTKGFFKFFMELSNHNQVMLCKWIDENYDG